jgi:hypothetical protein
MGTNITNPSSPAHWDGRSPHNPIPIWKRLIRGLLVLVVAAALIAFIVSRPTTHDGLRYFIGSIVVLYLSLSLLKNWP